MSASRYQAEFRARYLSRGARKLIAMLSRRIQGAIGEHEAVEMLGRESADGSYETDRGDTFTPIGVVARAAKESVVESLCAFIGGDSDHPVQVNTLDWGRQVVIDAAGLDADETIVYTQKALLKITRDGEVLVGRLDDFGQLAGFDSVVTKAEYDAHTHRVPAIVGNASYAQGSATGPESATTTPASETVLKVSKT